MRLHAAWLPVVLACVLPGCRESPMAVEADAVRVEAAEGHLVVTNGRHERIFYFAMHEDVAPLIEWVPCTSAACASVEAQTITRVPYAAVAGTGGSAILFHWWTAVSSEGNSPSPGPVHVLRVER